MTCPNSLAEVGIGSGSQVSQSSALPYLCAVPYTGGMRRPPGAALFRHVAPNFFTRT